GAHSAAAAWSFRRPFTGDVDVIVIGKEAGRRRPGIRVHRVKALEPRDIRRHQGIPITSPARTLLDIAPDLSDRSLEWALDDAVTRRLTSHAAVKAVLAAYPNRPSSHRLRALLDPDRPTTVTRSGGEEAFLAQVRRARLPVPEVNATVGRYSADFLWRDQKVILEIDGYDFHRGRAAFERDHERDAEHQHLDYVVIRATPRQLAREPQVLLVRVAMALARRMAA
ncbi:MAG TPA: DUF559 domain-containing protein, partial [Solirubrobacteraceae bacterium]|nr:DUF559 domain-containing protein [Solirubrobacteraceae bacterium]